MLYLCPPAILNIIISIISIIFLLIKCKISIIYHLINILLIILWTWLLNFICIRGYDIISWILVLLPLIITILLFIFKIITPKNFCNMSGLGDRSIPSDQNLQL